MDYIYNLATDTKKGILASILKFFLTILSFTYGHIIRVIAAFKGLNPVKLPCKVISVGNITLGGTGKTTIVEHVARYLKEKGHKVAILSRGYKKNLESCGHMGDEPYMLSLKLGAVPIIVDADRIRGAKKAVRQYSADTLIMDDGFQQWHIKKDLEIVAINALNPFGNKKVIPGGILREPLPALKRADLFILTKSNPDLNVLSTKDFLASINPQAAIFQSIHKPVNFYEINNPAKIANIHSPGKKAFLFSGIADPGSFESLIKGLNIDIAGSLRFADHYSYAQKDLDKIAHQAKEKNSDVVITTEKDAVRLSKLYLFGYGLKFLALRIELEIKDEHEFRDRLLGLYSS